MVKICQNFAFSKVPRLEKSIPPPIVMVVNKNSYDQHVGAVAQYTLYTSNLIGVVHKLHDFDEGGGQGSLQMITVLHRGGPEKDYGI